VNGVGLEIHTNSD
jgi:hypothetical protein